MTDDILATCRVMELGDAVEAGMDTAYLDLRYTYTPSNLNNPNLWVPAEERTVGNSNRHSVVIARPPRPKMLTVTVGEITLNNATGILRQHGYSYTADKLDAAIEAAQ